MDSKEFDEILNVCIEKIKDRSKIHRRDGLFDYHSTLFETYDGDFPHGFSVNNRLNSDVKVLSQALADESEVNRLKVTEILIQSLERNALSESNLVYIITAINARICHHLEESEEIRKELLIIMNLIINSYGNKIVPYKNDISTMLFHLLRENSPDNLRMACDCITSFFNAMKEKGECSLNLLRLLKKVSFHQRYKVREAALRALGCIGTWSSGGSITEITRCFAQHSDDIPHIRIAIIKAASKIACQMPDRYSYWHYILPCILLWLRDSDPSTREAAVTHYSAVGAKYLSENEETLLDQLNSDHVPHLYPPKAGTRSNLGCRLLAQLIVHKVLPGIAGDLRDWQSTSRVATIKLLSALVMLGESALQQHAVALLRLLDLALRDSEAAVVAEACFCAENLGYFLLPEVSIPVALEILRSNSEAQCHRSVKLLELLCTAWPASKLAPHVASAVDIVSSLSFLPSDAVLQDDVLSFVQMLIEKNGPVPRGGELGSSEKERLEFRVESEGLQSGLANAPSGFHDVGHVEKNAHVNKSLRVAEFPPKDSNYVNCSGRLPNTGTCSSSEGSELSGHSNDEKFFPSYQLLKCLLLVMGSNKCEVSVTRAQQLVYSLAETCMQHLAFGSRTNSAVNCGLSKEAGTNFQTQLQAYERQKRDQHGGAQPAFEECSSSSHIDEFFQLHTAHLLDDFLSSCELWTPDDPQFFTASAFLHLAGQNIPASAPEKFVRLCNVVFGADVDSLVLVRLLVALDTVLKVPHERLLPRARLCSLVAHMLNGFMCELLSKKCHSRETQLLRSGAVEVLASAVAAASGEPVSGGSSSGSHASEGSRLPSGRASGSPTSEHRSSGNAAFENLTSEESGVGPRACGRPDSESAVSAGLLSGLASVLTVVPALLHDDLVDTRLYSLRLVRCCAVHYSGAVVASRALPALAEGVVERLDDAVRNVRIEAAETLRCLVVCEQAARSADTLSSSASSKALGTAVPSHDGAETENLAVKGKDIVKSPTDLAVANDANAGFGSDFYEFEEKIRESLSRIILFLDDPDEALALAVADCCRELTFCAGYGQALRLLRDRSHITAHCSAIVDGLLLGLGS